MIKRRILASILVLSSYSFCYATPDIPDVPEISWQDQGPNSTDTQKITVSAVMPPGADRLYYRLAADNTYYYYGPATELSHQFENIGDEQTVYTCVKACDSFGNYSNYSSSASKIISDRTPPVMPDSPGVPTVQWGDKGLNSSDTQMITVMKPSHPSGADNWRVSYSSGSGTDLIDWISVDENFYPDEDIGDAQTVYYRVQWRDYDENGNFTDSAESPLGSVVIDDRTPPVLIGSVITTWLDLGPNTTDFQQAKIETGGYPQDIFNFEFKLLANGTTYWSDTKLSLFHTFSSIEDNQVVEGFVTAYDKEGNYSVGFSTCLIGDRTPPDIPDTPVLFWDDQGPNSGYSQVVIVSGTIPLNADRIEYKLVTENYVYYYGPTGDTFHQFLSIYDDQIVYASLKSLDSSNNFSIYSSTSSAIIELRTPPIQPSIPEKPVVIWEDQGPNSGDFQVVTISRSWCAGDISMWKVSYSSGTGADISEWIDISTKTWQDYTIHDEQTVCYGIQWKKVDEYGNWSVGVESAPEEVFVNDRTAPGQPGLPVLTWDDQGPNSGDSQKVTVNGILPEEATKLQYTLIAESTVYYYGPIEAIVYQFENIKDEQSVYGKVRAFDAEDNYSVISSSSQAVIGDRTSPPLPTVPGLPVLEWQDRGTKSRDTQKVTITKSSHPEGVDLWRVSYSSGMGTYISGWLDVSTITWINIDVHDEQTVYYRIQWRDNDSNGNWKDSSESLVADQVILDRTSPEVPSNLFAIPRDSQINLIWDPNNERDLIKYNIYRDNGEGFILHDVILSDDAGYEDKGLVNYSTYYYKITAVDDVGEESAFSNTDSCYPDPAADKVPPASITEFTADKGIFKGEVKLTWLAPGDNGISGELSSGSMYRIQYSSYVPFWNINDYNISIATSGVHPYDQQHYTVEGLQLSTTYYFRIWSSDEMPNWSGISRGVTTWVVPEVTPPLPDPATVAGIVVRSSAAITWIATTGSDANGVSYYFEGSAGSYGWTRLSSHTFSGLLPDTSYYMAVKLSDDFQNISEISVSSLAWTHAAVPAVPVCRAFGDAPNSGTGFVELTWESNGNPADTEYEVYCINTSSTVYTGNEYSCVHSGLEDETTYYYKVRAKNSKGIYTSFSSSSSAVTPDRTAPAIPAAPAIVWNDQGPNSSDEQKVTVSGVLPEGTAGLKFHLIADSTIYMYGPLFDVSYQFERLDDEQLVFGRLMAFDEEGNYSVLSSSADAVIGDRTPPSIPSIPLSPHLTWEDRGLNTGDTQDVTITKSTNPVDVDIWRVSYSSGMGTNTSDWLALSTMTWVDTEIHDNQTVFYSISWRSNDGNGNWSESQRSSDKELIIGDRTPPSNPEGLIGVSGNRFNELYWEAGVETDLSRYDIFRDTGYGFIFLDYVEAYGVSYRDLNLINHNTYYYRIAVIDTSGNTSTYSEIAKSCPYDNVPPSAVTDLSVFPGDNEGETRLIWSAPGDEAAVGTAAAYVIKWKAEPVSVNNWDTAAEVTGVPVPAIAGTREELTITGLVPGGLYYFALMSYDEEENLSEISNSSGSFALDLVPAPPADIELIRGEFGVTLNWPANAETDINHYNIYRDSTVPENDYYLIDSNNVILFIDDEVPQGRFYWYRITAVDNTGNESEYSVSVSTYISITIPAQPSGFTGTALSSSSIKWSWIDNSKNETEFRICNSTNGVIMVLNRNSYYWIEDELSPNTSYYRYVTAYNAPHEVASNTEVKYSLASIPYGLVSTSQTASQIDLSWDCDNAACFFIERAPVVNGAIGLWSGIVQWEDNLVINAYSDSGQVADTSFRYRVCSYNENGILSVPGGELFTKTRDIVAPGTISDLYAEPGYYEGEVSLSWTAVGDNAMVGEISDGSYEIRWSLEPTDEWDSSYGVLWSTFSVIPNTCQHRIIAGLEPGTTYYFRIKTADEVPWWSSVSNHVSAYAQNDLVAPAPVVLFVGEVEYNSVQIKWIAPGDNDNFGQAKEYEIKYSSTGSIDTRAKHEKAVAVDGLPLPGQAGEQESFTVKNLEEKTTYYFVLRTADEASLWSGLSNSPGVWTVPSNGDFVAPNGPAGLKGEWAEDGKVFALVWNQARRDESGLSCDDIRGYRVYRSSTLTGGYIFRAYIPANNPLEWKDSINSGSAVSYYKITSVDNNGNEGSAACIIDNSIDENTIVVSADNKLVLRIPKQIRESLHKEENKFNKDIRITITRIHDIKNYKAILAYEIKPLGAEDNRVVDNFCFSKSKFEISLSYKNLDDHRISGSATDISIRDVALGMFWYNGNDYINLGGKIDEEDEVITVQFNRLGVYHIQNVLRADELRITGIWPRKTFTPNGDGQNDTFNIRVENPWESNIHGYIYDINGTKVIELDRDGDVLYWDGNDADGEPVNTGIYIYQLIGENKNFNGTVVLAR